jgi:dipeptidyl aminopeptidase/acylaminoacyl peptidase
MLPLADLLRVPQVDTGLRFDVSPDGRNVAFAWNKTGNWEIYELPVDGRDQFASLLPLTGDIPGAKFAPQYSPDGKSLACALDADGSEAYHILLQDRLSRSHTDLTPDSAYAHQPNFAFSPDGETLAILSDEPGQFSLFLLSLTTQESKLLFDIQRPCWDVKWSPDGKWIAVEVEMQASDRGLFVVNAANGNWRQIASNGSKLNAGCPAWSPDSRSLAFSAETNEWFDIGLYELETRVLRWMTESTGDDGSPCWSRDGKRMAWLHAQGATNCLMVYEGGGSIQQHRTGSGIHHQPQFTPGGEILCGFESPQQPPDLWKLNPDGAFEQLTNSLPAELRDTDFPALEEVSYPGDGVHVPALLVRGDSGRAVINIHGGPNWNVQYLWDPFMAHLASRGWTVLAPNYRGSTGYGRVWQIASRFDMGGVDTRDCAAGVEYLLREKLAAPQKIAVTGRSHGGYLTMACLTQFPELWCGGAAVVPFMNWFNSHENSREDLQHWNIENMGDPIENHSRWYNASPYFFLEKICTPVHLICGANDPRCPASDSIAARDKLVELGKDVELIIYEDEGHSFLKIENVIDAEVKRAEFLAKVLL